MDLQTLNLKREFHLSRSNFPPLVIASDGRLDESAPASVATLIFDPLTKVKVGLVAYIPLELCARWHGQGDQYIVQVEQAAVVGTLLAVPDMFRGRDFLWFEDSSVVLVSLAKGSSKTAEIDAGTTVVHLCLAQMGARGWFEYVQSDSNWSDSASRKLMDDEWAPSMGFTLSWMDIPTWPWAGAQDTRAQYVIRALAL